MVKNNENENSKNIINNIIGEDTNVDIRSSGKNTPVSNNANKVKRIPKNLFSKRGETSYIEVRKQKN